MYEVFKKILGQRITKNFFLLAAFLHCITLFHCSVLRGIHTVGNNVDCDIGWLEHGSFCYLIQTEKKTWKDSLLFCENQGANLLSLADMEESLFIVNNTRNHYYWIGFNDIQVEGKFTWSDNTTSLFVNWKLTSREPNGDIEENCVLIDLKGLWVDYSCYENFMYICKLKKVSLNLKEVAKKKFERAKERRNENKTKKLNKKQAAGPMTRQRIQDEGMYQGAALISNFFLNDFTGSGHHKNSTVDVASITQKKIKYRTFRKYASAAEILTAPSQNQINDSLRQGKNNVLDIRHKRDKRYVLYKVKWKKNSLTWKLFRTNWTNGLSRSKSENIFQKAFNLWETYSNLSFHKLNLRSEKADIEISLVDVDHGDSFQFIEAESAHTFYPREDNNSLAGDIHLNNKFNFTEKLLFIVAVHEIGHSLGLLHTKRRGAIMYPMINESINKLSEDDVLGIHELYGKPDKEMDYAQIVKINADENIVPNSRPGVCHDVNIHVGYIAVECRIKIARGVECWKDTDCQRTDQKCCDNGCYSICTNNFTLPITQKSTGNEYIIIAAISTPIIILVIVFAIINRRRLNKWKSQRLFAYNNKNDVEILLPDSLEIFPENIVLGELIGKGAFGTVYIGKINNLVFSGENNPNKKFLDFKIGSTSNVAVKLLNDGANQSDLNDFREEINLMKEIGYHKNVLHMIGCSTVKKPFYIVVEYMENGDLLHFLRDRRYKLFASKDCGELIGKFMYNQSEFEESLETKKNESTKLLSCDISQEGWITPDDLLCFMWQMASGMEYLSSKKLVHRDLAARNILVGSCKNIKISDFGLTRKVDDELSYITKQHFRLPIKWMSIEAINDQIFTTFNDVWAYGVVLFEIVTLGGTPYPTLSNSELLTRLNSGYRMERPENCSQPMYDIMMQCWNKDPLVRPTFTELRERFDKILSQAIPYFSFDIDERNIYYTAASFKSVTIQTDQIRSS